MLKDLHSRDNVDRLYVSRREGGRELASIQDIIDTTTITLHKKARKKSNSSDQKHTDNISINKTKQKRDEKKLKWTFQTTNKQNLSSEDMDMA